MIYSRTCDRKSNPLRTIAIMAPSADSKDVPYTIMVASNVIELHQKARVRQKDTIISSFYNERFKHFVVVGARRIYMWNAYTGILAKTYNSELAHPLGIYVPSGPWHVCRETAFAYQSLSSKLKIASVVAVQSLLQGRASEITACCFGDEGSSILFGDDKVSCKQYEGRAKFTPAPVYTKA